MARPLQLFGKQRFLAVFGFQKVSAEPFFLQQNSESRVQDSSSVDLTEELRESSKHFLLIRDHAMQKEV